MEKINQIDIEELETLYVYERIDFNELQTLFEEYKQKKYHVEHPLGALDYTAGGVTGLFAGGAIASLTGEPNYFSYGMGCGIIVGVVFPKVIQKIRINHLNKKLVDNKNKQNKSKAKIKAYENEFNRRKV